MYFRYNCKHRKLTEGVTVKEPIIPVTLVGKNGKKLNFTAVLDSGSDFVLIPIEIAEVLELGFEKGIELKATTYTGEPFKTKITKVRIELRKGHDKVGIECRAAVNIGGVEYHDLIFGSTFFEHFKITFDYKKNKFIIKK